MNRNIIGILVLLIFSMTVYAQHPSLIVTKSEINEMKVGRASAPLFDKAVNNLITDADKALLEPVEVPVPCDGGGGVVHEKHKSNYYAMYHLGLAYQFTSDARYARKAIELMMAYAKLYPTLGLHPLTLSGMRGRLFWQTLNESVFLLHTAMAYDCIQDVVTKKERKCIENNLLLNMAYFIMNGYKDYTVNNKMFNRMHNHATWATASVGMVGLATDHKDLVEKALYGTDKTGKNGGFLMQMDHLFSPDGYYTEGAYYERYAIWPFVLFAQCLDHNMPELNIFHRRDDILRKALEALVQLSYNGEFFHFNDALQKGLSAQELTYAVNIIYSKLPEDKTLTFISEKYQDYILPIMGGYMIARDLEKGESRPIIYTSQLFRDGKSGDQGGVAVIRSRRKDLNSAITVKATAHGMEHGHFDKLTMAYYDNGNEILSDYGASRFLNIEAKYKGHYTKENKSYSKQTVAHNTVTVDRHSNYDGNVKVADAHHADVMCYDFSNDNCQYVTVLDTTAYAGVKMMRTVAYVTVPAMQYPLLMDVYRLFSKETHDYDYTLWYNGHFVSMTVPYIRNTTSLRPLGSNNGYQHIWLDAQASHGNKTFTGLTFFKGNRFYTINTANEDKTELNLLKLGANDPDYNLLERNGIMIREYNKSNKVFVSAIETHGEYDLVMETSNNLTSTCEDLKVIAETDDYTIVSATFAGAFVKMMVDVRTGKTKINIINK